MIKALVLSAAVALPAAAQAATYVYDFSTATAGTTPATPASGNVGATPTGTEKYLGDPTTIGNAMNDNWVWTSSTTNTYPSLVRSDTKAGFTGNYASGFVTRTTTPTYDAICTRKNDSNFSYSIPTGTAFSVSFTALLGSTAATANPSLSNTRSEVGLGVDIDGDGKIRGTGLTAQNAEQAPFFGYDPTGGGEFYIRPASYGTSAQIVNKLSGVYKIELDIDPTVNPNAVNGGNDGSGTLMIQQLFDGAGNPVSDTLHAAGAALTNVNLNMSAMNLTSNGGAAGYWNPATWNGLTTRMADNGAVDDITITTIPEPTSLALLGLGGLTALRRRRAR